MKKFCINVLQCRHSVGCAWTRASVMWSLLHGLTLVRRVILSTSQFCCVCASISIFSNEPIWRKVQSTYTVCGCAGVTKRLGPASENGPESSSNMLKPKGSLPNSPPPPIIPNKNTCTKYCHMTNYELLRWLVKMPLRDIQHYYGTAH